jgi:CO/xanthine dehydrogenase Mo-binding subunit
MGNSGVVEWRRVSGLTQGFQSSAIVSINTDGTANVVTGSPDIGGTRASCAMIAAEVLGLKAEEVHPVVADTESIGHTDTTGR